MIGDNLYEMRINAGLTQIEVAEELGIQNCDVSNYERNKVKSPRIETLIKFADLYGCTLEDIVGYTPKCEFGRYAEIDDTFEQMLISAERYAQGRQTYIVGMTAKFIKHLLPKLTDLCLKILADDLNKRPIPFVQSSDGQVWEGLLLEVESEIDARTDSADAETELVE